MVQVRARGFDVRYEILSPVPCPLFSIGRGEGHSGERCGMPPRLVHSDPHYLLALLRNGAETQADTGAVPFGGRARIRGEPWRRQQGWPDSAPSR